VAEPVVLQCGTDGGSNCTARIPDHRDAGTDGSAMDLRSTLTVPPDACMDVVHEVQVHVTAYHTWVGDLSLSLRNDTTGTVARLTQGSADHDTSCTAADLDDTFTTQTGAADPIDPYCPEGTARKPRGGLAATVFEGEEPAGGWTLIVKDEDAGPYVQQRLADWRLELVCDPQISAQPGRGAGVLQAGAVLLLALLGARVRRRRRRSV
jgi:subtilisin-like proprotein convertase family protein